MTTLYKRNAQGKPLVWYIERKTRLVGYKPEEEKYLEINYGLVGGTLHTEKITCTLKNADEFQSRINAKRKEGYKELSELKDGVSFDKDYKDLNDFCKYSSLIPFLNDYLPKYNATSEGFVLPMLAKVLEDNKPFEKYGTMLGQWKIDGLRCIIGAEKNKFDLFTPITLTYHSRTGENWTNNMKWMDEIILPKLEPDLLEMMIEEGACLDGELYLPGYAVNDINSFVKNTALPQHYQLQYWCYDICCENMSAEKRDAFRRFNIGIGEGPFTYKQEHLNNKAQVIILPTFEVENIEEATKYRNKFIDLGFEGLILRNPNAEYQFGKRNQAMFKFKKVDDGYFKIINIIPEHKRSDLPIFVLKNDINEYLFECSINKPQEVQRQYLAKKDDYIGKYMLVEFRARSGVNQVPFHARGIDTKKNY